MDDCRIGDSRAKSGPPKLAGASTASDLVRVHSSYVSRGSMMRLSLFNAGLLRQYEDVSCAKPGQQIPAEHAPCYDRIPIRGLDESTEVVHRPPPPFHGTRNHPVQGRDVPGHPEIITTISGKRKEASPVVSEMGTVDPFTAFRYTR